MSEEHIGALGRRAARANLNWMEAKALFNALYVSDALMLAQGNSEAAAEIAGVNRVHLYRMSKIRDVEDGGKHV